METLIEHTMKTIEEIYADMFEEHERIFAANPYGCNQYGHRKGHGGSSSGESSKQSNPEKKGDNKPDEKKSQQDEKAPKKAPDSESADSFKPDKEGDVDLILLPNGDVIQVSRLDLQNFKNTSFSAFHINEDGTFGGTPEKGLMIGATLDEALERFPALSDSSKQKIRNFYKNREKGGVRFHRLLLGR
jgi:hypothetical protein